LKISIIGAGNVAWHLSQSFEQAGHIIEELWSRTPKNAKQLAAHLYDVLVQEHLDFSRSESDLFILSVSDDVMEDVVKQLVLPENSILVHTSGTKSLGELQHWLNLYSRVPIQTGVFYPLQTFSKHISLDIEKVPICIEASTQTAEDILVSLAQDLSEIAYIVSSQERRVLHVAAVMACNFTNHLWALTKDFLDDHALDFAIVKPLIEETTRKAMTAIHPAQVQTGPARRKDQDTIYKHQVLMGTQPENYQKIYKILTDSIIKYYE
jgi:predicted short-subunit dehydrogenase-like oxidoreductase (DUF2520 family)